MISNTTQRLFSSKLAVTEIFASIAPNFIPFYILKVSQKRLLIKHPPDIFFLDFIPNNMMILFLTVDSILWFMKWYKEILNPSSILNLDLFNVQISVLEFMQMSICNYMISICKYM